MLLPCTEAARGVYASRVAWRNHVERDDDLVRHLCSPPQRQSRDVCVTIYAYLRLFLLAVVVVLCGTPSPVVLAHHCGADQPLPEFPGHSCHTRTQSRQPGEAV